MFHLFASRSFVINGWSRCCLSKYIVTVNVENVCQARMKLNSIRCSKLKRSSPHCSLSLSLLTDIDECFHGFVECDDKAICVNLPGWYHCECRDGYHDNGLFSTNGESCIGELTRSFHHKTKRNTAVVGNLYSPSHI